MTAAHQCHLFDDLLVSYTLWIYIFDSKIVLAYTRIRTGRALEYLEDSDGMQIVVHKNVPDTPAVTVGPIISALCIDDPNLSSLCLPLPGHFVEPFPLAWQEGFHVITGGSKVGITPHWFVYFNITPDAFRYWLNL